MSKFFNEYFAVLATLRNEHDHATLMALVKWNVTVTDPIEVEHASILTPYTLRYYSLLLFFSYCDYHYHCRFVSKQLKLKSSIISISRIIFESENECEVASLARILQATILKNLIKITCCFIVVIIEYYIVNFV